MGFAVQIQRQLQFATEECCNCGVLFAVPDDLQNNFRKTKKTFYCPNGHPQSYTESEADRLRRQLEESQRSLQWEKDRAASLAKQVEREKKTVKQLQKRAANGVCPCCQRTVAQLARHMKTKHPDFIEAQK